MCISIHILYTYVCSKYAITVLLQDSLFLFVCFSFAFEMFNFVVYKLQRARKILVIKSELRVAIQKGAYVYTRFDYLSRKKNWMLTKSRGVNTCKECIIYVYTCDKSFSACTLGIYFSISACVSRYLLFLTFLSVTYLCPIYNLK